MILETVKYADSDPVAVCVDYVPIKFLDKPPRPEDLYDSIFEGLERHHGINIRLAECEILSVAAEPAQAEDLSVGIGTPLLLLRQVHIDIKERRILYSKSYFPSNKLTFRLIRHRQNITY
jgi:GntR family transcriptional regulator